MTGQDLKRSRLKAGIVQQDMAKELKINASTLCRIENGQQDSSLRKWSKILNAYGFTIVSIEPKTTPDNWNDYTEQA